MSIDWLLGFDVPMQRDERSRIGVLSTELHTVFTERRPASGFAPELFGRKPTELANDLVDEWWSALLVE